MTLAIRTSDPSVIQTSDSQAFDELAAGTGDPVEAEFKMLSSSNVDNELAALKAARSQRSLPAAGAKQIAAPEQ